MRECALVRFADDPDLLHWRMVLHCFGGDKVLVVTPDRDINDTTLKVGDVFTEVIRLDRERLPHRVRERETYLPRHSADGNMTIEELRQLFERAEKIAERQASHELLFLPPIAKQDRQSGHWRSRRLRGFVLRTACC